MHPLRREWPTLTFDPVHHEYRVGGDQRLVLSVTQVLEKAGLGLAFDSVQIRNGMNRGRAVHLATQYLDEGCLDRKSVVPEIAGFVAAYERFKEFARPEIFLVEQPFVCGLFRNEFAGTIDRVVRIGNMAGPLDIKTGSIPKTTSAQLAGYSQGLDDFLGTDLFADVRKEFIGTTRTRWSLLLRGNGTFALNRTFGGADIWMAALTIAKFKEASYG